MKSNTSIIAILALFVLISVVSGQTSSSSASAPAATNPNAIAQCIKDKGCNDSDQHCRAQCAGVPDPSNSDAKNTDDCVAKCDQSDTNAYAQCKANCINQNYYPQGSSTSPNSNSGSPSASSNSPGSTGGTSSSGSSGNSSSSSSSSSSSPSPSSKNNANVASPTNNAFTALVLCIVAGVMTLGF